MNVRNTRARLCAVLFTSLFTSISFAQVSAVSDRASLAGTDFIDWQDYHDGVGEYTILYDPGNIATNGGAGLTVMQPSIGYGVLIAEPNNFYPNTAMPDGEFLYHTNNANNYLNVISFSNFDGIEICALGTQVVPIETGTYTARIQAFNAVGSLGYFDFTGATSNPDVLFVGIENSEPMSRVEVSILNAGTGTYNSYYAINRVDIRACADEPEVPEVSCDGFEPPMDNYPVTTKKNRVFPLKMELFDADGFALTNLDLAAAPVVEVVFMSSEGGDAIDVSEYVLSPGKASEGNQFVFEDGIWQFRLSSKTYTASGTYMVTAVSGDDLEYVIDPSCVTSFVK